MNRIFLVIVTLLCILFNMNAKEIDSLSAHVSFISIYRERDNFFSLGKIVVFSINDSRIVGMVSNSHMQVNLLPGCYNLKIEGGDRIDELCIEAGKSIVIKITRSPWNILKKHSMYIIEDDLVIESLISKRDWRTGVNPHNGNRLESKVINF